MSENTQVDLQKSITERLNSKLKEALIDLIPPEVLQQKTEQAAAYFLNGKTHFTGYHADDERKRYQIHNDPDTLVGLIYAEMKRQAVEAIKQEFATNPLFKPAYDAAAKDAVHAAITQLVTENAGAVLVGLVGDAMALHMQQFAMNFENNLRSRGFHI